MPLRRRTMLTGGAAAVVAGCTGPDRTPKVANSFAVRGVRVFNGQRLTGDDTVLVYRGWIRSVGRGLLVPEGVPVVHGRGGVLLPGLIDTHVHVGQSAATTDALRFGVTTMVDMFGDHRLLAGHRKQRASPDRVGGADVWGAGTAATVPGGYGTQYGLKIPTITAATDLDAFVADRVVEGSDFLKIFIENGAVTGRSLPTLEPAQVRGLVAAAHARQRRVAVHVSTVEATRATVDAGADYLAHVPADAAIDPALAAAVRARMSGVVATLSVLATAGCTPDAVTVRDDPRIRPYLSPTQWGQLTSHYPHCWTGTLDRAMANVAALRHAGVPIMAGTDAGNPGTTAGASLLAELGLLVRAGLTPVEALKGATSLPARSFNLIDRGRIAAGMRADLVLIHGDPTTDIHRALDIAKIWKNGYPVTRTPTP